MPDSTESDNLVYLDDFRVPVVRESGKRIRMSSDLDYFFQTLDLAHAGELHRDGWDGAFEALQVPVIHIEALRSKLIELGWNFAHPGQMGKRDGDLLEYKRALLGAPDITRGVRVSKVPFKLADPLDKELGIRCFTNPDRSLNVTTGYFKKLGGTEFFQCGYSGSYVELPDLPLPVFWSKFEF